MPVTVHLRDGRLINVPEACSAKNELSHEAFPPSGPDRQRPAMIFVDDDNKVWAAFRPDEIVGYQLHAVR
jgi:hypothetical protein